MKKPDPRRNAYSNELANAKLEGQVGAERFAHGKIMSIVVPVAGMYATPNTTASLINQAILGDQVNVFEIKDGWAWGQLEKDEYVGYLPEKNLVDGGFDATHRVSVPASFFYPEPDIKSQPATRVFMNSQIEIVGVERDWAKTKDGKFIFAKHICSVDQFGADPVSEAEKFLNAPYLWGGSTLDGLDCSALVQQAYHACGKPCPRDTDMIETDIGSQGHNSFARGDLVFWDGHIGMMVDEKRMIHANGHHMAVVIEDFTEAEQRINKEYGSTARIKRP